MRKRSFHFCFLYDDEFKSSINLQLQRIECPVLHYLAFLSFVKLFHIGYKRILRFLHLGWVISSKRLAFLVGYLDILDLPPSVNINHGLVHCAYSAVQELKCLLGK